MPTYGYRCEAKGHEFEVFQSMTDEPLKKCQVCGSPVRRIFYPVGIVFKGPGFYKTDSRGSSAVPAATTPSGGDKPEAGASEKPADKTDAGGKSEAKSKKSSKAKSSGDKK